MKRLIGLLGCVAAILTLQGLNAAEAADSDIVKALKGVSTLELPAKASSLVAAAQPKDRQSTALAIIEALVTLRPSATPSVVAALAKSEPSIAPEIVTFATKLQPKQADLITAAGNTAAAGGPPQPGTQPPNHNGNGNGGGNGDGGGNGKGNAYGHAKNYCKP